MDTSALVQYGAVGLIAVLALQAARLMFTKLTEATDRERARADRLEEELRTLNEAVRKEYTGTLTEVSQNVIEATKAVTAALAAVRGVSPSGDR